jgi:predicted permease
VTTLVIQMVVLVGSGILWSALRPGGIDAEVTRRAVTGLVFHVLLPALVLVVMWRAPVGSHTALIALCGAAGVLVALAAAHVVYRLLRPLPPATGALLLASSFGNVTYLGLPVLEAALGPEARPVAIVYDLFACTPLLLTVGVAIARVHGPRVTPVNGPGALLRTPPLWAAAIAVVLNATGVPLPPIVERLLEGIGAAVVPLMLISVGLALQWRAGYGRRLVLLGPAAAIQVLLMPLVVGALAGAVGLEGTVHRAVVLEAAMPTMLLGLVLCDEYGLDTPLYAEAITLSTVLSMTVLPLWMA